jgi:hypothetical protein
VAKAGLAIDRALQDPQVGPGGDTGQVAGNLLGTSDRAELSLTSPLPSVTVFANGGQAAESRAARWAQAGLVTACRTWPMADRTRKASVISMMP